MLAAHELTHVMKQLGYKPYLDFIEATPDHLNMRHSDTQLLLDATASHRGLDMLNLTDDDRLTLYDEFNSSIYGSIAGKHIDDVRDRLGHVFRDFDAYSAELTELHRRFKASRTGAKYNSEALELCRRHPDFYRLAGSDTHQVGDECRAGVILPERVQDSYAYKRMIENRQFQLWSKVFPEMLEADLEMRKNER